MALGSGLGASVGFKVPETAWGTYTAPDTWLPFVNEGIKQSIGRLESKGIVAGARTHRSQQWAPGNVDVAGPIGLEVTDKSLQNVLRFMFGATSGTGPWTLTPGDLVDDSATIQIGKPDVGGTVNPFTYTGCVCTSWEVACSAGEIATLGLDIVGKAETTATGLVAPSYASPLPKPMTYIGGGVTVAGSSKNITAVTLGGDNSLKTDRRFLGSASIAQPLEAAKRAYTGKLEAEFESLTEYNRYVNATEFAVVFTLASGSASLVFTLNARYDGETPNVGGEDIIPQSLPFKLVGPTTDADAITAVFTAAA